MLHSLIGSALLLASTLLIPLERATPLELEQLNNHTLALPAELVAQPPDSDYQQSQKQQRQTRVGIAGDRFTINGKQTFLLGTSYFDASHWRVSDLDQLAARKFNLIRIWLDWRDRGFFDTEANLREQAKLLALVRACNARGIVVDVTIAKASSIPKEKAVRAAVRALKQEPNVIFDIQNEHNLGDSDEALSLADVRQLYFAGKAENARAIIFVSNFAAWMNGNKLKANRLTQEVNTGIDLVAPHFTRNAKWYEDTATRVAQTKQHLRALGKNRPVYLQEEHRNRWEGENFTKEQFIEAAEKARDSGAAGWIFHTDAGFSLNENSFFAALDPTERQVVDELGSAIFPD